jgi:hypothetical protein
MDEAAKGRFRQVALSYLNNLTKVVDNQVGSAKKRMLKAAEELQKRPSELVAAYEKSGAEMMGIPIEQWIPDHLKKIEMAQQALGGVVGDPTFMIGDGMASPQGGAGAMGEPDRQGAIPQGRATIQREGRAPEEKQAGPVIPQAGGQSAQNKGAMPDKQPQKATAAPSVGGKGPKTPEEAEQMFDQINSKMRTGTGAKVSEEERQYSTRFRQAAKAAVRQLGPTADINEIRVLTFKIMSKNQSGDGVSGSL